MKRRIWILLMVLALLALVVTGCASNKTVTTGTFAGQTYTNDFFGLSLSVPPDWHIASKDEMQKIYNVDQELVGSNDQVIEKALELGKQKTIYLFLVNEYPLDHTGSFNSNASLVCENLSITGLKAKNAKGYMLEALKALDHASINLEIDEIDEQKIGRTKVASVYCELEMQGIKLRQRYVAAIVKGYALMLTLTYPQDASVDELSELQNIVASIEFK